MTTCELSIANPLGLHARAAAKFVHLSTRFEARVRVSRDRREMDEFEENRHTTGSPGRKLDQAIQSPAPR